MKRILAIILTIIMTVSAMGMTAVFAEQTTTKTVVLENQEYKSSKTADGTEMYESSPFFINKQYLQIDISNYAAVDANILVTQYDYEAKRAKKVLYIGLLDPTVERTVSKIIDMEAEFGTHYRGDEYRISVSNSKDYPVSGDVAIYEADSRLELFEGKSTIEVTSVNNEIQISIIGRKINFIERPFIDENGRTQVPVRDLCDFLGREVYWFENPQRVLISNVPANVDTLNGGAGGDNIQFVIGESQYIVNGQTYAMDTAAKIINGRTYIPLRTAGEFLQYNVVWKGASEITRPKNLDLSNVLELPSSTIKSFFSSFAQGDFESMKKYCTQECIDTYFHAEHGDVFGLKKAELLSADATQTYYDTPPNEYIVFVDLKVEPSEYSSIYPSTDFGFFVHLLRQSDGTYLINNFSTSGI